MRSLKFHKGVTLVEVLVAGTVLLLLTGALYGSLRITLAANRKSDSSSDAYRACMLGLAHLQRELRGARLESVSGSELSFRTLERDADNNPVVLNADGTPSWSSTLSRVYLDPEGRLILENADTRILASLGNSGSITFSQPSSNILGVEIAARHDHDPGPGRGDVSRSNFFKARVEVFLSNQSL